MARSFKVVIVTPDRTAFEGEAVSATIPGQAGYLGVWANHAPLVAAVSPGLVTLRTDDAGNEQKLAVGGGFVEISGNVVNLMTDTCEMAGEIDVARAQKALERARERLSHVEASLDREQARLDQSRALARLKAARKN
jgi:F-type H+-transporting ATPase subunit epsilon